MKKLGKLYFASFSPQRFSCAQHIYTPLPSFLLTTKIKLSFICCHVQHANIQTTRSSHSLQCPLSSSNVCSYSTTYFINMAGECLHQAFHTLLRWSALYIKFNKLSMLLKALACLMVPSKLFKANAIVMAMLFKKKNNPHEIMSVLPECSALVSISMSPHI